MSAVGENPFVYPHCWFYDFALFLIKKGLVFADARAKHKSCGRVPFHRQLALRYCHILNAIVLLLQDKCIWGPEQQQLSGGRKVMAVPLRAVLGGREELRARVLVSLVALVSEPSDGGALLHFWEQAKQALSIVSHLALLLNLNVFCLLHIRYSGPYTLVISKPWLRKHYSRSKSLKSLRAVSPFHLYPCIKYERVSPAAQLSAPPVCSPLCNGLISAGVTGEPRRLLIYSWLFKDLFVSWGCCLRWLQAGICERTLGKGKCVHSSQRAPHLQRDCLERFRSPTDVISWNCKCFVFLFYNGNEREKKTRCSQQVPRYCRMLQKSTFFFFNYYFGRSAVFPWLPFVKIPAAGIRVNSRSSRGSPEVGCCGLGQGEDAGIAQRLHCQQCLPPAPPLPWKRQSCALFYAFFPSSRLFPHWGHAAVTRKFIKPRNCKENVDLSPCCQIRVA